MNENLSLLLIELNCTSIVHKFIQYKRPNVELYSLSTMKHFAVD